ncbi:MAG TPA: hypothetical protein VGV86_07980 [Acidimicrobiales bacterium]|nr:hypothetical protein [Acidimicrobiales bacterium]
MGCRNRYMAAECEFSDPGSAPAGATPPAGARPLADEAVERDGPVSACISRRRVCLSLRSDLRGGVPATLEVERLAAEVVDEETSS